MVTSAQQASSRASIIVASPNEIFRKQVIQGLQSTAECVEEAVGGADALNKLERGLCRVLFLDRKLSDLDSEELVRIVGAQYPTVEVVPLDPQMRKPVTTATGKRAPMTPSLFESTGDCLPGLIGASVAMQRVFTLTRRVAGRNTAVLLTGETGTGKEVIARAIHELSPRTSRAFITVNCAAIPDALLESELFGHTRGAFTGAVQARLGRVHAAQGGTLFLDEIGDMPLSLQSKLLRFLESGEVQRLGSSDLFRVDVRVVAATNANLTLRVAERQFREDLYYRLAVFPIELPPLRERGSDTVLLAKHFLREFCGAGARLDEAAEHWIAQQAWRGNVRELRHCIERASILWSGEGAITPEHLNQ